MGAFGGFDTHERLVRELANKANVAVVFVDYTLSLSLSQVSSPDRRGLRRDKMGRGKW
jgi:hypothetical protein